jgi:lysophospholipid acyltransferase (LPLAT)-like uncharacterized protein
MIKKIGNIIISNNIFRFFIYLYLKFVYKTSRYQFTWQTGDKKSDFMKLHSTIFILWHNTSLLAPNLFKHTAYKTKPLVSPSKAGNILYQILKYFNYQPIKGSSNKNPAIALKNIIKNLAVGNNIVITADGSRGPKYTIKTNIAKTAYKYNHPIIAVSCSAKHYFSLPTWDRLIIPLPFTSITIKVSSPIKLSGDIIKDNELLKTVLNDISNFEKNI